MSHESSPGAARRLHAVIRGLVQGVNFRAHTARHASALGLRGWVRNLPDGTVETVAEGPAEALETFLRFLHSGPPSASVEGVESRWEAATGEYTGFQVRYW